MVGESLQPFTFERRQAAYPRAYCGRMSVSCGQRITCAVLDCAHTIAAATQCFVDSVAVDANDIGHAVMLTIQRKGGV